MLLKRQAGDQHHARADAVDQKADRRLQQPGNDVEYGERQRQLDIADVEVVAHEGEQRRQHEHVIMAHHVRRADRGDQPRLRGPDRADRNDLRHCGRAGFAVAQRLPDAERRQRHVDMADAVIGERVHHRVHHRGQPAGAARFAAALDAERIGLGRHRMIGKLEVTARPTRAASHSP